MTAGASEGNVSYLRGEHMDKYAEVREQAYALTTETMAAAPLQDLDWNLSALLGRTSGPLTPGERGWRDGEVAAYQDLIRSQRSGAARRAAATTAAAPSKTGEPMDEEMTGPRAAVVIDAISVQLAGWRPESRTEFQEAIGGVGGILHSLSLWVQFLAQATADNEALHPGTADDVSEVAGAIGRAVSEASRASAEFRRRYAFWLG